MDGDSKSILLRRELEQWYRAALADASPIVREWGSGNYRGALDKKTALYSLAAERLDIKVFRHYPLFFECGAFKPLIDTPSCPEIDDEYRSLGELLSGADMARLPAAGARLALPLCADELIKCGTDGLKARINQSLGGAQAQRRREFCAHAITALDALEALCDRFTSTARHMIALEIDPAVKARLGRIADFDVRQPANSLFNAAQAALLWREAVCALDGIDIPSWGNLDLLLDGFEFDSDSPEIIRALLWYHALRSPDEKRNLVLGWNVSAATLAIIDALDDEVMRGLNIYLYAGDGDSPEYAARLNALMQKGATLLNRRAFDSPADIIGGSPARAGEIRLASAHINLPAALMGAYMPETVDNWRGFNVDPYLGDYFAAEDLYSTALDYLAAVLGGIVSTLRRAYKKYQPLPLIMYSAAVPQCAAAMRDITDFGAESTSISVALEGAGVFTRSLASIKHLCYDSLRVPPYKLKSALKCDYEGDDALMELCAESKPDHERAILEKLARELSALFVGGENRSELRFVPTLLAEPRMGSKLIATPDGRLTGEGLESDMLAEGAPQLGGTVASLWAPENDQQAEEQRARFVESAAGMLQLFAEG